MESLLYKNEYVEILGDKGALYVKSTRPGMTLEQFFEVLRTFTPGIRMLNPEAISHVLTDIPSGPELFGEERERVSIRISEDGLKAYLTLYVLDMDLASDNRASLLKEIIAALHGKGIVYGMNTPILMGPMKADFEYLIAEGLAPIHGTDAEIKLYEVPPPQPRVINAGKVDHYELNLINRVREGDWLGERKDPTPGIPGKDVTGGIIPPIPGRNLPLMYDRVSVREEVQNGITTLRAKKTGAVYYKGDTIGVYDFLEIKGDVNFSTGNIDFDGFLSVKGTVQDNFTVTADKDIEILGEYGVGAAEKIFSRQGNIYIKGGIAGKGRAFVRCKKNLYVKYLSDITVECEGSVYVGFYCMNANIKARQVIVESPKGRITGGQIDAEICVSAAEIGSRGETRTIVGVRGFDRTVLHSELDKLTALLSEKRNALTALKRQMDAGSAGKSPSDRNNIQERLRTDYAVIKDDIKELEYQYKNINEFLKTPGEGAVIIKNRLYPRVRIEIKGMREEITDETGMITYCCKDNELLIL